MQNVYSLLPSNKYERWLYATVSLIISIFLTLTFSLGLREGKTLASIVVMAAIVSFLWLAMFLLSKSHYLAMAIVGGAVVAVSVIPQLYGALGINAESPVVVRGFMITVGIVLSAIGAFNHFVINRPKARRR